MCKNMIGVVGVRNGVHAAGAKLHLARGFDVDVDRGDAARAATRQA